MRQEKVEIREEEEIDLISLFGVLFRNRRFILLFTCVSAVCAVGFSIMSILLTPEKSPLPNQYRGHALILVLEEDQGSFSSIVASSGLGSLAGLAGINGSKSYCELAVKLLSSNSILDVIMGEFSIAERYNIRKHVKAESRKEILKRSEFNYDSKTSTVSISYEDYDPVFSAQVVNRMVELLDQRFAAIGGNRNLTRKNLLENKLADVLAEMSVLETAIQDFQTKHGVLTVEDLALEQITILARLRSQVIGKEMEIKTYSDFSKMDDPVLRRLKSERDNLLSLLREVEGGFSSYEAVMPPQKQLPELARKFANMKRDLLVQVKVYEILTQQYELVKLEVEAQPPVFQVLELAEPSDKKSGPSRSVICIVATVAAFFLSVILVFIMNAVSNIRNDPEKLRKLKGLDE